jgi:hypothetical protein
LGELDHLDPGSSGNGHDMGRATTTGKGHHEFGPALSEHALVPDPASLSAKA